MQKHLLFNIDMGYWMNLRHDNIQKEYWNEMLKALNNEIINSLTILRSIYNNMQFEINMHIAVFELQNGW